MQNRLRLPRVTDLVVGGIMDCDLVFYFFDVFRFGLNFVVIEMGNSKILVVYVVIAFVSLSLTFVFLN